MKLVPEHTTQYGTLTPEQQRRIADELLAQFRDIHPALAVFWKERGTNVNRGDLVYMARHCSYMLKEAPDDPYMLQAFERWQFTALMPRHMFNECVRVGMSALQQGQTQTQAADAMQVTLTLLGVKF